MHDSDLISFWDEFAREYWERKPLSVETFFSRPALSEDDLFQTLLKCCDLTHGKTEIDIRLYVEGQARSVLKFYNLLPKAADSSLEGYNRRIESELKGQEYVLIVNYLEVNNFALWAWTREFLKALYERVGMNKLGVYYAVFLGNYHKTPAGVHHDPESVFHLPVAGQKRMRVWPEEFIARNPRLKNSLQYEEFLDASTLLKSPPGGFIYWPSNAWHVSEGIGEFSASLALTLNCFKELVRPLMINMEQHYDESKYQGEVTIPFHARANEQSSLEIPEALKQAAAFIQSMSSVDYLQRLWLKMITGSNFLHVPKPQEARAINQHDLIRGSSEHPVKWLQLAGERLAVSANGHLLDLPDHSTLRALIERVNTGGELQVGQLLEACCTDGFSINDGLSFLSQLQSIRGISKALG